MKLMVMVAVLAVPVVAAADPEHFVTLDRQDDTSRIGAEASDVFPAGANPPTSVRLDLHGQVVDPASGFGGYASIPVSYASGGGQNDEVLGDVELGGIFSVRLANPNARLILHAGLTLPTANKSDTSSAVNLLAFGARLGDFYQVVPQGTSLRLGISPIVHSGQLFARADLGFDANLASASGANVSNVVRLQFGAGVDFGQAALMIESINLYATGSGTSDPWLNTGALSFRLDAGQLTPYAAFVLGLDDDVRAVMHSAFTVGIEGFLQH